MSDLFEPLRTPTAHPSLPPEAVRRRGDRFRRRRQALQAAGAACAVALVATGALLLGGDADPTRSEPPVATPGDTVTRIPGSFPLAEGLTPPLEGEVVGPGRNVRFIADLELCDADYSPADLATDRLTVTRSDVEAFTGRDLSLYPDAGTASEVALDMVSKYDACPRYSRDGGTSFTLNDVRPMETRAGVEGSTVVRTYETDGLPQLGHEIVQVVQVGNAVLVTSTYGEGPGATDAQALERDVQQDQEALAPLLEELCALTGGC